MRKLLVLTLLYGSVSCQQSHADKPKDIIRPVEKSVAVLQSRKNNVTSCLPDLYPDTWVDTVLAHPKISRTNWDDECVLATIDSIEAGVKNSTCSKCMEALDAVANEADGYVAEALDEVVKVLYNEAFESFIAYLAAPKVKSDVLIGHLVVAFQFEISDDEIPEQRRAEILADIQKKKMEVGRTEAQKRILSKIAKMVKEKKDWE